MGKFYELMILLGIAGIFQMVDVSVGTISYEIDTMFMNRLFCFCIMIWCFGQWRKTKNGGVYKNEESNSVTRRKG